MLVARHDDDDDDDDVEIYVVYLFSFCLDCFPVLDPERW